jgi:hypothetical protein
MGFEPTHALFGPVPETGALDQLGHLDILFENDMSNVLNGHQMVKAAHILMFLTKAVMRFVKLVPKGKYNMM